MRYHAAISGRYFKRILSILLCFTLLITGEFLYPPSTDASTAPVLDEELSTLLQNYFNKRCEALLSGDTMAIEDQFDLSSKYGKWSYEHESKRIKFLRDWSATRGAKVTECETKLKIFSIKKSGITAKVYLSDRTKVTYVYNGQDIENEFCYGTRHSMRLVFKNDAWYVTVDWYSDPLEDSIPASQVPKDDPSQDTLKQDVSEQDALEQDSLEIESAGTSVWLKYDRAKAVAYADRYCGTNIDLEDGYKYNKKYRSYADLGGDCANFASQILADKEAGGIRMGGGWLYRKGEASASWVNAGKFTYMLLHSGRGKLTAKGKYEKVVNSIGTLSPGDIIAYQRKGDIVHVSVVTALDSKGVPMVNSHTNDRYHVPWDLGWNDGKITFYFVHING